jgi:hypothetical protein
MPAELLASFGPARSDDGTEIEPARICRDERFGKHDEVRTAARRIGEEVAELLQRALDVEGDWSRLDGGDAVRTSGRRVCAQGGKATPRPHYTRCTRVNALSFDRIRESPCNRV